MIPYASTTRAKQTIAKLRNAGWRLVVTPEEPKAHGLRYGIDNGAWTAFRRGTPWDADRFVGLVERQGADADWIVIPDIVAGGAESLALSRAWLPRLRGKARLLLLAVQDGMVPAEIADIVGPEVGIFVGGSTEWKLGTVAQWGDFARERNLYLHVARVNTQNRIRLCKLAGAQSFDGSSVTRFSENLARLDPEVRQHGMWDRAIPPLPGALGGRYREISRALGLKEIP